MQLRHTSVIQKKSGAFRESISDKLIVKKAQSPCFPKMPGPSMARETLVLDRAVLLWAQMRGGLCPDPAR